MLHGCSLVIAFSSVLTSKVKYTAFLCFRYNHLMFTDFKEPLVEVAAQLLVVLLDHDNGNQHAISEPDMPDLPLEVFIYSFNIYKIMLS